MSSRIKAGIITIHFPYNYGAMLQAYATQQYLNEIGVDNEIIDFRPYEIDKDYHIRIENIKKRPKIFINMCVSKVLGKRKKYDLFEKFIKQDMRLSKKRYAEIKRTTCLNYDVLIAGSDQIWNPDIMQNRLEYVLDFDDDCKKISYASSFGTDSITADFSTLMKEKLEKFSNISVREQQGVTLINNMGINGVSKVCDPVFLLPRKQWQKLKEEKNLVKEKYILLYSLQNNEEMNERIIEVSKAYGYKIVSVHPTGNEKKFADYNISNIGPKEFIAFIDNADFVFSNSFHAIAFSIIFNKKIFAFLHTKTGARVKNMLEQFCMASETDNITGYKYYRHSDITENKINELVFESKEYIKKAIL